MVDVEIKGCEGWHGGITLTVRPSWIASSFESVYMAAVCRGDEV